MKVTGREPADGNVSNVHGNLSTANIGEGEGEALSEGNFVNVHENLSPGKNIASGLAKIIQKGKDGTFDLKYVIGNSRLTGVRRDAFTPAKNPTSDERRNGPRRRLVRAVETGRTAAENLGPDDNEERNAASASRPLLVTGKSKPSMAGTSSSDTKGQTATSAPLVLYWRSADAPLAFCACCATVQPFAARCIPPAEAETMRLGLALPGVQHFSSDLYSRDLPAVGLALILERVWSKLVGCHFSQPFMQPFSAGLNEEQRQNFQLLVPNPVDLSLVGERVRMFKYKSGDEFKGDIASIEKNCRTWCDFRTWGHQFRALMEAAHSLVIVCNRELMSGLLSPNSPMS